MKNYYLDRLHWIFHYTSKNFGYVVLKTLCLVLGVPTYAVLCIVEMIATFLYAITSFIPVVNVVTFIICRMLLFVCDLGFYVNILPDLKAFKTAHPKKEQETEENSQRQEDE